MDKEQARFILNSYRAGIDDPADKAFAAALAIAADNRELGEWLARERAMDEAFTRALGEIELPSNLRDDIIGCLEGERRDYPEADDRYDAVMIGALASVTVPPGLRENILMAMARTVEPAVEETAPPVATTVKIVPIWRKLSIPLAAAAGIALALLVTRPTPPQPVATAQSLPIEAVPVSFIQTYQSPSFALDVRQDRPEQLVEVLKSRSLPCPCCLPPGLEGAPSVGCRELTLNGKHGSLICFRTHQQGVVHLVIFSRNDVDGSCSNKLDAPCYIDKGSWSIARWQNDKNVFFLIGETDLENLKKLF